MGVKPRSRFGEIHQINYLATTMSRTLMSHSIPGPYTFSVTIIRNSNPRNPPHLSSKKEGDAGWCFSEGWHICVISCLILLIGLEHLFTFSLDSLTFFSPDSLMLSFSHQPRASEMGRMGIQCFYVCLLLGGIMKVRLDIMAGFCCFFQVKIM